MTFQVVQAYLSITDWGNAVITTGLAASMAVNALVTGLIVFKILKVFLEVNATSNELTLGSTGETKLQHVIFIIIESGMALFAIQLIRVVFYNLPVESAPNVYNLVISIHQMLNVITRPYHFYFFCFSTDNISQARESHQQLFCCGFQ